MPNDILRKIIPTSTPRFGGSVPGGGGLRLPSGQSYNRHNVLEDHQTKCNLTMSLKFDRYSYGSDYKNGR